jgi:hypothetical protein
MSIIEHQGRLHISRVDIAPAEFPALLQRHHRDDPDTRSIEEAAAALAEDGFSEARTAEFIRSVCRWGGYSGVAGRVLRDNETPVLSTRLAAACAAANTGDPCAGLSELLKIRGLAVSFASKHLRFLAPDSAIVLDRIISSRLGYPLSISGYRECRSDCLAMLSFVQVASASYPGWARDWRVCDIEMAVFMKLRN